MSRTRSRARRRCAREQDRREELQSQRVQFQAELNSSLALLDDAANAEQRIARTQSVLDVFNEIAASDIPLWPFAKQLTASVPASTRGSEDQMAFHALIARIVAPRLAGPTPGNVHRRHKLGK